MIWLYRILSGFLKVAFYGDNKEKILSRCAENGITLWNTRFKEEKIESYITVRDFKAIRKISRNKGVRVHILTKIGIPFITERYKKRWGIVAGAVIFFFLIEFMSGYIWIIDINGNHKVSDEKILAACAEIGIKEGIGKKSFNPKTQRERLLLRLDGIAWASLNVEGSRLTVNVTETRKEKEEKTYSNLKSDSDGVIEKIDIVSGISVVKVGDAVKKGDLLVSGIVETADDTRFVNSKGTVTARVEEKIVLRENFEQKTAVPTGAVKTKHVLDFFGIKIPLYLGREPKNYESSKRVTKAELFGQKIPLRLYEKRFEFYEEKTVKYSYEDLCERLENKLENQIKGKKVKIISKEFSRDDKSVTLTVTAETVKNIVFEDILLINAGNHGENVVK